MGVRVRSKASIAEIVGLPPNWSLVSVSRMDPAVHNRVATIFSNTLLKHCRREIGL